MLNSDITLGRWLTYSSAIGLHHDRDQRAEPADEERSRDRHRNPLPSDQQQRAAHDPEHTQPECPPPPQAARQLVAEPARHHTRKRGGAEMETGDGVAHAHLGAERRHDWAERGLDKEQVGHRQIREPGGRISHETRFGTFTLARLRRDSRAFHSLFARHARSGRLNQRCLPKSFRH